MTAHHLYGETYAAGNFHHWRSSDRRLWWIMAIEPMFGSPMAKAVMDDFGNLVRVSAVM